LNNWIKIKLADITERRERSLFFSLEMNTRRNITNAPTLTAFEQGGRLDARVTAIGERSEKKALNNYGFTGIHSHLKVWRF
jgi:hypothetical protein